MTKVVKILQPSWGPSFSGQTCSWLIQVWRTTSRYIFM
eukprot:CAMPEP_0171175888 /NCGR_PEP_ID=MMETSP0790-20130122/11458_1 /TAXON_ID=2925 /ORGANISM="Alexandrium catenella, Strain OF101" /LENGTH=37 /DNA_ID= /DNA_START= /DNA_END= /DNA_ORIENTATION=